jgi:nickel/cobalt transporter (NiCoT) family protein
MTAALVVAFALGVRHGTDPDHLTAIDGLSRIRPRSSNGLLFAIGQGSVVTLLATGVGRVLAGRVAFAGPWLLILIGLANAWKIWRPTTPSAAPATPIVTQPVLLGMLLAAGFETASQLSALILAGQANPWLFGAAFSVGMMLVDGVDGYLAASTLALASGGAPNAKLASTALGALVVIFSLGLGVAELTGVEMDRYALAIGLALFAVVIGVRIWARSAWARPVGTPSTV